MGSDVVAEPVGRSGVRVEIEESQAWAVSGFPALLLGLVLGAGSLAGAIVAAIALDAGTGGGVLMALSIVVMFLGLIVLGSLAVIAPGSTRVVSFFGRYIGTVRRTGLVMVVPFSTRKKVSVKVHNF
ncbi:MAG: SPFH domain-containing protein, partial [Propioniciclava sp.]